MKVTKDPTTPGISPKQLGFLLVPQHEALFGGAAGGGKSEILLAGATQYVDGYPSSALLLRRTYRDLDKPGGLMFRAREWFTGTEAHWDGVNYRWMFPSGGSVNFGYMEHERDELKYQSSEYQFIGFDELTHFPEHQYLYMFSRLRRLKSSPVPLRMRSATNPGGPGHEWVRKRFSLPEGPPPGSDRKFIPSFLYDNPFLDQEEYKRGLEQLGTVTRAQLLGGDWSATATGGYFDPSKFQIIPWSEVPPAEDFTSIVRYWDFASSEKTELNPDPDYTVGVKVGRTFHGHDDPTLPEWYILDVVRFRAGPGQVETEVRAAARRDGPNVTQWIEQERGSAGKHLAFHYKNTVLPGYTVRALFATGTKEARAAIAAARVNEQRVFMVDGEWNDDFIAECAVFPLGSHDDQVDGISNGLICLEKEFFMHSQAQVKDRGGERIPIRRGKREPAGRALGY